MDWYEAEVRELEKATANRVLPKNPVVFYGSSTIRLWDTLADDLDNFRAINLGFGGSTLEACAHFFERLVVPVAPCSLVVYAGDNDLGDGRSAQEVFSYYKTLEAKIDKNLGDLEFGFISIKPSLARFNIIDRIRTANRLIKEDISARKRGYFIDLFEAMLKPDGMPDPKLFCEDGLHMSRAGYRLWTERLSAFRNRMFTPDCSSVKESDLRLSESESRISPLVQPKP
jgi:lysophospholipase L1-like esterase